MGKIGKSELGQFAKFNCDRKLTWTLGYKDKNWLSNRIKPVPLKRKKIGGSLRIMGKKYESRVYDHLNSVMSDLIASDSRSNEENYRALYKDIINSKYKILIESTANIPNKFYDIIFSSTDQNKVTKMPDTMRPDLILMILNETNTPITAIDENGEIKSIDNPYGMIEICVVDIKLTSSDNITKSQYFEILYYPIIISHLIHDWGLDDKFYISVNNNGIFGNKGEEFLKVSSINDILEFSNLVNYNLTKQIIVDTFNKTKELYQNRPHDIDNIAVNIQPICGQCIYLDDCKKSLGWGDNPSNISVQLIPFVSNSLAKELNSFGFYTVGDIITKLPNFQFPNQPSKFYIEQDRIKLVTDAINMGSEITNTPDAKSLKIPRYSDFSLIFVVEVDPIYRRTTMFSTVFEIKRLFEKSRMYDNENKFWIIYNEYKDNRDGFLSEMDNFWKSKEMSSTDDEKFFNLMRNMSQSVTDLANSPGFYFDINKSILLEEKFAYVNDSIDLDAEFDLIKVLLDKILDILFITSYLANVYTSKYFITKRNKKEERYALPSFALYYYGTDTGIAIKELVSRQYVNLLQTNRYIDALQRIIKWFSRPKSDVEDPQHHLKFFDLKEFSSGIIGYPCTINYTWHEIYESITRDDNYRTNVNYRFWQPHYSYIDIERWYEYIESDNIVEKDKHMTDILYQLIFKARSISRIRKHYQSYNLRNELISGKTRIVNDFDYDKPLVDPTYHRLAKSWSAFSKLTGNLKSVDNNYLKSIFPKFSVGKLFSGKISDLNYNKKVIENKEMFTYTFSLRDMSSNMKLSPGSYLELIPVNMRDYSFYKFSTWSIIVRDIEWNEITNGYDVTTEYANKNIIMEYMDDFVNNSQYPSINNPDPDWYIFPTSFDNWSSKLFESVKFNLLDNLNLGNSVLGHLLSQKMDIEERVDIDGFYNISLSEIFMYAPSLLNIIKRRELLTLENDIFPVPDESQTKAIKQALSEHIFAIIGPPGTGKSTTIVALLEEFDIQWKKTNDRPFKVLISSFSYNAMNVVEEKIKDSVKSDGSRSDISRVRRVKIVNNRPEEPNDETSYLVSKGQSWQIIIDGEVITDRKGELVNGKYKKIQFFSRNKKNPCKGSVEWYLNDEDKNMDKDLIFFSNAHQLYKLMRPHKSRRFDKLLDDFKFDLIIIDEASQYPVDYFLSPLSLIDREINFQIKIINSKVKIDTKSELPIPNQIPQIILVGDDFQLPSVQPIKPPEELRKVMTNLFKYFIDPDVHGISNYQIQRNYRSNKDIVDLTFSLGFYDKLDTFKQNKKLTLDTSSMRSPWREIIDVDKVVVSLMHDEIEHQFDTAISEIEVLIVKDLIVEIYLAYNPADEDEERLFWDEFIGVASPHVAHGRAISRLVVNEISGISKLDYDELDEKLRSAIVSVDKFQGSDRDIIISTIGVSSIDQLSAEEEFIYSINRFNVLSSRAKYKFIMICSRNYLTYTPRDLELLQNAALIRNFHYEFCDVVDIIDHVCKSIMCGGKTHKIEIRWKKNIDI